MHLHQMIHVLSTTPLDLVPAAHGMVRQRPMLDCLDIYYNLLQFTTIYYNLQQKLVPPNKLEPISFSSTKAKNSETLSEIVRVVFKILRKA